MAPRPVSERQLRRWWLAGWPDEDALRWRLGQLLDAGIVSRLDSPRGTRWTFLPPAARLEQEVAT